MLLTMADSGKKNISVYGPPNLQQLLYGLRYFVRRDNFDLRVVEFAGSAPVDSHLPSTPTPLLSTNTPAAPLLSPSAIEANGFFQDELLTVWPVVLAPDAGEDGDETSGLTGRKRSWKEGDGEESHEVGQTSSAMKRLMLQHISLGAASDENTIEGGGSSQSQGRKALRDVAEVSSPDTPHSPGRRKHSRHSHNPRVPLQPGSDLAVCYICQTAPIPGKFDPKKVHNN